MKIDLKISIEDLTEIINLLDVSSKNEDQLFNSSLEDRLTYSIMIPLLVVLTHHLVHTINDDPEADKTKVVELYLYYHYAWALCHYLQQILDSIENDDLANDCIDVIQQLDKQLNKTIS